MKIIDVDDESVPFVSRTIIIFIDTRDFYVYARVKRELYLDTYTCTRLVHQTDRLRETSAATCRGAA